MKFKHFLIIGICLSGISLKAQINPALNGNWLGTIVLDPTEKGMDVPFNMSISSIKGKPSTINIRSAADKIVVKRIS